MAGPGVSIKKYSDRGGAGVFFVSAVLPGGTGEGVSEDQGDNPYKARGGGWCPLLIATVGEVGHGPRQS